MHLKGWATDHQIKISVLQQSVNLTEYIRQCFLTDLGINDGADSLDQNMLLAFRTDQSSVEIIRLQSLHIQRLSASDMPYEYAE